MFAVLANPVRRRILELLLAGPRTAGDIASEFELNRPSVSEHVHVLQDSGLVMEQRTGRQHVFTLNAVPLSEAADWLHQFERYWRRRMHALGETLDKERPT